MAHSEGAPSGSYSTHINMETFAPVTLQVPSIDYHHAQYPPKGRRSYSSSSPYRHHASTRWRQSAVVVAESVSHCDEIEMELSRHKLKAASRTSALLAGFAMVALVELDLQNTAAAGSGKLGTAVPHSVLIIFAIVTTLLVSVHLLALMMSTCMLPHMEALGTRVQNSPHHRLRYYIEMSWFFATCLGLILFLLEIGIVFWIKFTEVDYKPAAVVATWLLFPVFLIFLVFTYHFYRKLMAHHVIRLGNKLDRLRAEGEELRKFTLGYECYTDTANVHVV